VSGILEIHSVHGSWLHFFQSATWTWDGEGIPLRGFAWRYRPPSGEWGYTFLETPDFELGAVTVSYVPRCEATLGRTIPSPEDPDRADILFLADGREYPNPGAGRKVGAFYGRIWASTLSPPAAPDSGNRPTMRMQYIGPTDIRFPLGQEAPEPVWPSD
jgi:hypothetical protein